MKYRTKVILRRIALAFSIIPLLFIAGFSLYLYLFKVEFDSNLLYIIVICSSLFAMVMGILSVILSLNKLNEKYLALYRPISELVSTFLFSYDLNEKKVHLDKHLAKFINTASVVLTVDEMRQLFTDADNVVIRYDDLVLNGSSYIKVHAKNGKYVAFSFFANKYKGKKYVVGYVNDFTLEYIEEQSLLKAAHLDTLTETYRRSYFVKNVKDKLENTSEKGALIFMDVDNFKGINDKYGHSSGDIVLMKLGNCLKNFCKDKKAYIARSGGDEFLLYFYDVVDYSDVYEYLKGLVYAIKTISIPDIGLKQIYVSMGVSFFPMHSNNYEALLKYADDSLYRSKSIPGTAFTIYDEDKINNELNMGNKNELTKKGIKVEKDIFSGLSLGEVESLLRKALINHEFQVYIQPEVSPSGKSLKGECLVRWISKENGIIYPNGFVPYFERTGLVSEFDFYMFNEVLGISQKYIKKDSDIKIAVNQSIKTMVDPNYGDRIKEIYNKYHIVKGSVAIELTEKAMFTGLRHISKAIELFHSLGMNILIDDFGTGFTSLQVIKDMDIDVIKIDRSFLSNQQNDFARCEKIIKGIVDLAHSLKISTIIEGIETEEQFKIAIRTNVDYIQGFIFSSAIPVEAFFKDKSSESFQRQLKELINSNEKTK